MYLYVYVCMHVCRFLHVRICVFIQGVRKGLQAIRDYSAHLSKYRFSANIRPETNTCWDRDDDHVISTADAQTDSHAFQHNFQSFVAQRCALCRKFLVSLKPTERYSPLFAVISLSHWWALNKPKSSSVPTTKNPEDWGQEIVQASWLCPRVLFTAHQKSGSGAVWQCGDVPSCMNHMWCWRSTCSKSGVPANHSP
jgi:hypothetical protein